MKTLEDYNAGRMQEIMEKRRAIEAPDLAGVLCPDCNEQMEYIDRSTVLMSNPAKRAVLCLSCDHRGYKIVG